MAGLLGYLSILADDIGSLAGKTAATTAKSLATSLDDIGILFDDIATYTKLASIKSSGLLVDDLAAIANFTNETTSEILKKELEKAKDVEEFENNVKKLDEETQQKIIKELEHIREVARLEAKRKAALRELPIVYKIAKGSFINKFIIIPVVLLLSYIAPWAIAPILIIGGAYLAYEGVESILEKFGHHQEDEQTAQKEILKELEHIREVAILEAKRKAALRELPIVYKIAKGSFINKFIIIPVVLLLSYIAPWAIAPILIIGGAYLAYEGIESILEKFGHHQEDEQTDQKESSNEDFEDQKVKSAIKTDFILSFEIIVISLSLLDNSDFITKLMVLISVGILTTVLVYGIVALIIKLDDIGFYLQEKKSIALKKIGDGFVKSMPYIIKTIGILGTIAMLAVGGGIIAHETHILQSLENIIKTIPLGGFFSEIILGAIVGYIVVLIVPIFSKIKKVFKK